MMPAVNQVFMVAGQDIIFHFVAGFQSPIERKIIGIKLIRQTLFLRALPQDDSANAHNGYADQWRPSHMMRFVKKDANRFHVILFNVIII